MAIDPHTPRQRGAALLEVIAAVMIAVIAAAFVLDAVRVAVQTVHRGELEATAADLAAIVLSDVQMSPEPARNEPPRALPPRAETDPELFPGWTFELVVTPIEELPELVNLKRIEVIVRNDQQRFTHRLWQWILDEPEAQGP